MLLLPGHALFSVHKYFCKVSNRDINTHPLETGCNLNIHMTFRRRVGRLLDLFFPVSLRFMSRDHDRSNVFIGYFRQVFGDWVEDSLKVYKGIPPWENSCLIPTIKTVERRLQIAVLFYAIPNDEKHLSTFSVLEPFLIVPIVMASNGLVVKARDFQSRGPVFKTTGWLQGRLSLSFFQGRWSEYQEYLGT